MEPHIKAKPASLYDTDYQLWLDQTIAQLKLDEHWFPWQAE